MSSRVYVVVNEARHEAYIGFTSRPLAERWYEHQRDAADPRKRKRLYEAMRHDPTAFEILECEVGDDVSEASWVAIFREDGYTILNEASPTKHAPKARDKDAERRWREVNEEALRRTQSTFL